MSLCTCKWHLTQLNLSLSWILNQYIVTNALYLVAYETYRIEQGEQQLVTDELVKFED